MLREKGIYRPREGKSWQNEILLTCSTSGAFVRFTSSAVQAGVMAQVTVLFGFKLSPGALHNTVAVIKDSFKEDRGIITNQATVCSLNLKETKKKLNKFFSHSIYKSLNFKTLFS